MEEKQGEKFIWGRGRGNLPTIRGVTEGSVCIHVALISQDSGDHGGAEAEGGLLHKAGRGNGTEGQPVSMGCFSSADPSMGTNSRPGL